MRAPSTAAAAASPRAAASSSSASSSSAPPLAVGDEVEVECTALAFGGRGVCRLESGFVLLCDRATPGETVVARVTGVKGGGRFAEAAKVRTSVPSPHAVESPCPHFAECGGCTWQDVSYAAQLDMKREQVLDVLRRTAKVSPRNVVWGDASSARWKKDANARSPLDASALDALVPPTLPAPFTARYRNKMEFAFAASPRPENGVSVPAARLGLRPPGDHATVVEVTSHDGAGPGCLLQHPVANAVLASVQAHLRTHEGAAAALPAFDRRTGAGVLRSVTVRVSSLENQESVRASNARRHGKFETADGGDGRDPGRDPALAAVDVAACVSSDPRERRQRCARSRRVSRACPACARSRTRRSPPSPSSGSRRGAGSAGCAAGAAGAAGKTNGQTTGASTLRPRAEAAAA